MKTKILIFALASICVVSTGFAVYTVMNGTQKVEANTVEITREEKVTQINNQINEIDLTMISQWDKVKELTKQLSWATAELKKTEEINNNLMKEKDSLLYPKDIEKKEGL